MNIKLLLCSIVGHDFNETTERSETYEDRKYIIERHRKCERCQMSEVTFPHLTYLYHAKYCDKHKVNG